MPQITQIYTDFFRRLLFYKSQQKNLCLHTEVRFGTQVC